MKRKKIVVALGHKALGTTLPEQKAAVKRSAKVIADLVAAGDHVVLLQEGQQLACYVLNGLVIVPDILESASHIK